MDFASIGGFLFSIGMIVLGATIEHVTLKSMVGESAFLIVVGGALGASALSHTVEDLRLLPGALKLAFMPPKRDWLGTIDHLMKLAEKARRSGLLSLQEDAEQSLDPLIQRGLTMVVDGGDPEIVVETLQVFTDLTAAETLRGAAFLETAGGYSPTLGILGTVMGLVTIMGNLSEPDTLGPAIAVAFLATLYGVGIANLVFLPLGAKIKAVVLQRKAFNLMIIEGINGIQTGSNSRGLREKLTMAAGSLVAGGKNGKSGATKPAGRTAQEGA